MEPLLTPPGVQTKIDGDTLKVTVRFPPGSGEESWPHLVDVSTVLPTAARNTSSELIPDENTAEMIHDTKGGDVDG